ncbi:15521_t:CDS:1, partial [Dentiscutata heterogama]
YYYNEPIPETSTLTSQNNEQYPVTTMLLSFATHETQPQPQFTTPEAY